MIHQVRRSLRCFGRNCWTYAGYPTECQHFIRYIYRAWSTLVFTKFSRRPNNCFILCLLVRTAVRVKYWRIADSWISALGVLITADNRFWYIDNLSFSCSGLCTRKQLNASSTVSTRWKIKIVLHYISRNRINKIEWYEYLPKFRSQC